MGLFVSGRQGRPAHSFPSRGEASYPPDRPARAVALKDGTLGWFGLSRLCSPVGLSLPTGRGCDVGTPYWDRATWSLTSQPTASSVLSGVRLDRSATAAVTLG